MEGCRWRVGNGKSVKIWKDSWLPGLRLLQPTLGGRNGPVVDEETIVDSDATTKTWNAWLVRALFNSSTVEETLKIRFSAT